jgi:hypothetical protein
LIKAEKTTWESDFKNVLKDAMEIKPNLSNYDKNDVKILAIEQRADKLLDLGMGKLLFLFRCVQPFGSIFGK